MSLRQLPIDLVLLILKYHVTVGKMAKVIEQIKRQSHRIKAEYPGYHKIGFLLIRVGNYEQRVIYCHGCGNMRDPPYGLDSYYHPGISENSAELITFGPCVYCNRS